VPNDEKPEYDPLDGYVSSCCGAKVSIAIPDDGGHTSTGMIHCDECGKTCTYEEAE
jgi:hypothetical protein